MAVSPHGESSFFPGGGECCVDGAVKLLFLCFVSSLGLDGWAVSGFGHGDGASFFSSCAGDRVRFVLLPSFSGVGYVVGGGFWCSSVGEWCTATVSPVGGLASAIFFIAGFSCVDARIFCVPSWVVCCPRVNGDAQSVPFNLAVVWRRLDAFTGGMFIGFVSLQGVFLWRLKLHQLLYAGRCSCIPFVGLWLVGRNSLVMRLASVPSEVEVCPGRSSFQQHDVLLMGSKFEDSSSIRESAGSFILDLLHCRRWRTRLRQRRSVTAKDTRCSCNGCICNFISFQRYPVRGLVVRILYQ